MKRYEIKTIIKSGVYTPCKVGERIGNSLHGDINETVFRKDNNKLP